MLVAIVEAFEEVFCGKEDDPLAVLVAGDDATRGEGDFGWFAVAAAFFGLVLGEPLDAVPTGAFEACLDLVF